MPVTRFTAKIDRPATWSISRSSRNVITIAKPPTSSGSAAATRPRKTQNESSSRIGKANISARLRSEDRAVVDLAEGDVVAAQPGRRCRPAAGARDRRRLRASVARGERGKHERLAAVARDQLGQVRGRVVERALKAPAARTAARPRGRPRRAAAGSMRASAPPRPPRSARARRRRSRRTARVARSIARSTCWFCACGSWKSEESLVRIETTGPPRAAAIRNRAPARSARAACAAASGELDQVRRSSNAPPAATPRAVMPSPLSSASRQTSTETSSTVSAIGGSGLVAFTHTPSSS